ncbi:aminotransferase class I/II-fold pyridoxal phosphate-dependent enzyme [Streptomyces sp. NPDC088554]|uniref:aminotransferase class I/II-fold pyridoxal phosphate-dependent enzyme n=1 Tax=Streptomyces sp. NPDC088554 TaxID=3365865 RepID=UPI00382E9112
MRDYTGLFELAGVDYAGGGIGTEVTDDMLRLHQNESPYRLPGHIAQRLAEEARENCSRYPAAESSQVRRAVAEYIRCAPEQIAVGNGVDELIHLVVSAFARGGGVAVPASTFPGYRLACTAAGIEPQELPAGEDGSGTADAVVAACEAGVELVFLCNPHNPTGALLDRGDLARCLTAADEHGTVLVVDEAYMDFVADEKASALEAAVTGRCVLVLRTFSKAWGLASLRVGYAVGPEDLVGRLWRARQSMPFHINRPAQIAVPMLLAEKDFLPSVRRRTGEARDLLCGLLGERGIRHLPSAANFVMVEAGPDSTATARRLANDHRILVRDLAPFGRAGWIRVTVGVPADMERFADALAHVLGGTETEPATATATDSRGESVEVPDSSAADLIPHWLRPTPTLEPVEPAALFNGYTGAQVVFALHRLGIWSALGDQPVDVSGLARRGGVSEDRMRALLRVMALLGYVRLGDATVALTDTGRALVEQAGLFVWGVGGYGSLLANLHGLATRELTYGQEVRRDEGMVAIGAGEADRALMQKAEAEILAGIDFGTMADIGCGDATRLIRLCTADGQRRGIGIDISRAACELATDRVGAAGLADRVDIVHENVLDTLSTRTFPGVDLVTGFLMLHDLFATDDDHAAVLRTLRAAFPDARSFLFADTALQDWDDHSGPLPIFNLEFELVHAVMGVPLRTKETYLRAFADAGFTLERCVPFGVPATWAFLLSVPEAE